MRCQDAEKIKQTDGFPWKGNCDYVRAIVHINEYMKSKECWCLWRCYSGLRCQSIRGCVLQSCPTWSLSCLSPRSSSPHVLRCDDEVCIKVKACILCWNLDLDVRLRYWMYWRPNNNITCFGKFRFTSYSYFPKENSFISI